MALDSSPLESASLSLSDKAYRIEVARNGRRRVSAEPARQHLEMLTGLGHSMYVIANACGRRRKFLYDVLSGRAEVCNKSYVDDVLKVKPADLFEAAEEKQFVPSIGTQRRIMALVAMGHPSETFTKVNVTQIMRSSCVWAKTHREVAEAYARLSNVQGPSSAARRAGLRLGYLAPAAWDDPDDPFEVPKETPLLSVDQERVAIIEDMLSVGKHPLDIAEHFGIKPRSVSTSMRRAGRPDLARPFDIRH